MSEVDTELTLSRALVYEVLKASLYPPSSHLLRLLADAEVQQGLKPVTAVPETEQEGEAVAAALARVLGAAAAGVPAELGVAYQRLFGHTARGTVPPYETEYGLDDLFRQAQELADIGGFYRAFGLTMDRDGHERNDHLAVECEFLSFLCRKEAFHLLGGDRGSAEEVRGAERLFLKDHVGRFGRAFARALSRESDHPFYRAVGELLDAFLAGECRRLGVGVGPEFVRLRSTVEAEVPMACGGCRLAELS